MTELAVYFPERISISSEQVISEANIPLLSADKIASGTLHPDRIPVLPISKVLSLIVQSSSNAETDVDVIVGQPLYLQSNGHLDLAQANAIATCRICGLALTDANATTAVNYSVDGTVDRADWTPVTGTVSLTPGAPYYLSPDEPGKLTTIAPETVGQIVALVGFAISATRFAIEVQTPILL